MGMQEVVPNLWIGDFQSARDEKVLENKGITHVVAAITYTYTPPRCIKSLLQISVEDNNKSNIIQHFERVNKFIGEALESNDDEKDVGDFGFHTQGKHDNPARMMDEIDQNEISDSLSVAHDRSGQIPSKVEPSMIPTVYSREPSPCSTPSLRSDKNEEDMEMELEGRMNGMKKRKTKGKNAVLVHCQAGVSRSTTLVAAYLMKEFEMDCDEAVALIAASRSIVQPTEFFLYQLEMYEACNCEVDPAKWPEYRRFLMNEMREGLMGGDHSTTLVLAYYPSPSSSHYPSPAPTPLPRSPRDSLMMTSPDPFLGKNIKMTPITSPPGSKFPSRKGSMKGLSRSRKSSAGAIGSESSRRRSMHEDTRDRIRKMVGVNSTEDLSSTGPTQKSTSNPTSATTMTKIKLTTPMTPLDNNQRQISSSAKTFPVLSSPRSIPKNGATSPPKSYFGADTTERVGTASSASKVSGPAQSPPSPLAPSGSGYQRLTSSASSNDRIITSSSSPAANGYQRMTKRSGNRSNNSTIGTTTPIPSPSLSSSTTPVISFPTANTPPPPPAQPSILTPPLSPTSCTSTLSPPNPTSTSMPPKSGSYQRLTAKRTSPASSSNPSVPRKYSAEDRTRAKQEAELAYAAARALLKHTPEDGVHEGDDSTSNDKLSVSREKGGAGSSRHHQQSQQQTSPPSHQTIEKSLKPLTPMHPGGFQRLTASGSRKNTVGPSGIARATPMTDGSEGNSLSSSGSQGTGATRDGSTRDGDVNSGTHQGRAERIDDGMSKDKGKEVLKIGKEKSKRPTGKRIRCKMCRRELASREHIIPHAIGEGQQAFAPQRRDMTQYRREVQQRREEQGGAGGEGEGINKDEPTKMDIDKSPSKGDPPEPTSSSIGPPSSAKPPTARPSSGPSIPPVSPPPTGLAALRIARPLSIPSTPDAPPLTSSKRPPSPPLLPHSVCSSYFVEPLSWMDEELVKGNLAGRLVCPNQKCESKLGGYDWAGSQCSCGSWITPGFSISVRKVDEIGG